MRANHPARALLRGAMAAVLACGLMMPAGAIAAEAQGTERSEEHTSELQSPS